MWECGRESVVGGGGVREREGEIEREREGEREREREREQSLTDLLSGFHSLGFAAAVDGDSAVCDVSVR